MQVNHLAPALLTLLLLPSLLRGSPSRVVMVNSVVRNSELVICKVLKNVMRYVCGDRVHHASFLTSRCDSLGMSPTFSVYVFNNFIPWSQLAICTCQVHHIGLLDAKDLNLSGTKKKYKLTSFANSKLAQVCVYVWSCF